MRVGSAEFQRNFGRYQSMALTQPITVTRNGRDRIVLLSAKEYDRLKRRDREVLGIEDFTDEDIAAITTSRAPEWTKDFDHEVED